MRLLLPVLLVLVIPFSGCFSERPSPSTTPPPTQIATGTPPAMRLVQIVSDLEQPVFVTSAEDGTGRLFVVEQAGRIRVVRDGQLLPTPFLDISALVETGGAEEGLLGLAFHPNFPNPARFFVYYTNHAGNQAIARYSALSGTSDLADPTSGTVILTIEHPTFRNHNGGMVAFGPDGYLYAGTGDGGSGDDPIGNGQNKNTLLGKLLRIDVDVEAGYGIPPDNPFQGENLAKKEIWAYGLRNPWRFSFDGATGNLLIGDVGQDRWEEIDYQAASSRGGENYGWDLYEGNHPHEAGLVPSDLVFPVHEYALADGNCSVTGGYVYRGSAIPGLDGFYLFGDYCAGKVWTLQRSGTEWKATEVLQSGKMISSFGEDEAGEVYLVDHGGAVYRFAAA